MIPLGAFPLPLLHGVSGATGIWDEVVTFGLIGLMLAALLARPYLGGRRRRRRERREKRTLPRR